MEGYANLVDLISQLPSDFKRVEEAIRGHRDNLLAEFRNETRPLGQVIDEYLVRHDDLRATPEGKAFDGAFSLLRDEVMLSQLKRDLDVIASHSFTEALTTDEVRAFRGTVKMVRRSLEDVLDQRSRVAKTLRDHLVNHDAVKERELSDTLAQLNGELAAWIEHTSTRARANVGLLPEPVDTLPHIRERFYDPGDHVAPERLDETTTDAGVALTLEEILRQGGPLLARLAEQLSTIGAPLTTAGARFAAFPDDLRRPVEVLGLLHLLSKIGALEAAEDREPVVTVRSDGSERLLRIPTVTITDTHLSLLAALELT
jgi:hypothetical protein